jgi:hypothetical protein
MLFILTILFVLVAAVAVTVFVKRRIERDLIGSNQPKNLMDTNLRPLFAADEEEVRASEAADTDVIEAEPVGDDQEKKLAKLEELRQAWGANPDKRNTIELLAAAAETGVGEMYAGVAGEVVARFRKREVTEISAADLADLLETHLWLLSPKERMSGEGFFVKQEISELRA